MAGGYPARNVHGCRSKPRLVGEKSVLEWRIFFFTGKHLELYSTIEAPAESARKLVTMMPGAESNQHSVTSSVLACLAHR